MPLAAISTYEAYLAVHILAAVIWVGGAFATQVYAIRAMRSGDARRMAALTGDIEWVGTRVFVPASLVLVVFGFLLIGEGGWDYETWIVIALAIWGASFVTGAAFLGPESGRLSKVFATQGPESPEAVARVRRIFLVSRVELAFLVLVVLDMALKPGG